MPGSIALIVNPIAGRGAAARVGTELAERLMKAGFATTSEVTAKTTGVVTLGGDGTVRRMLPDLLARRIPLYAAPLGNENLFSRELKHRADAESIVSSLLSGEAEDVHLGRIGAELFTTMLSIGLDSEVVKSISGRRTSPIGTKGYLAPTIRAALKHTPPRITLTVDGIQVLSGEQGLVVIANTRQYARGLCPVPEADPRGMNLRARFFPAASLAFYLRLVPNLLARSPIPLGCSRPFAGERFELQTQTPFAVQADGDFYGSTPVVVERERLPLRVYRP